MSECVNADDLILHHRQSLDAFKRRGDQLDRAEIAKLEAERSDHDDIDGPFERYVEARSDFIWWGYDHMTRYLRVIEHVQGWPKSGWIYRSVIATIIQREDQTEKLRVLKAAGPEFSTARERLSAEFELDRATELLRIAREKLGKLDSHGRWPDRETRAEVAEVKQKTADWLLVRSLTTAEIQSAMADCVVQPLLAPKKIRKRVPHD